ncbi:hypothetical protein ANN_04941 [Periplaneta americana]|uniref:Uncharacterized protein n=1 Tax=Periplaneta americana TaxID=6978 RepID=A0ABQ8TAK9_PERAM|nr:hypothetical protein ANN_04941 [Periplaneta americana]
MQENVDDSTSTQQQRLQMWFKHEGTPAHFFRNEREHLMLTFQERWIDWEAPRLVLKKIIFLSLNDTSTFGALTEVVNILQVITELDFENGDALYQEYCRLKAMMPILKDLPTPLERWDT